MCIFAASTVMHFIISQEIVILARPREELTLCKEFYADVWGVIWCDNLIPLAVVEKDLLV